MDVLINIGFMFGGSAFTLVVMSLCSIAGKSENNLYFYREISRLRKRLEGSYNGIKKLKAKNKKLKETIELQEAHIEALEEMSDGLINGQETVEKICKNAVQQTEIACSEKIGRINKNNRTETRRLLDEIAGKEQYIRDLEAQNVDLNDLLKQATEIKDRIVLKNKFSEVA